MKRVYTIVASIAVACLTACGNTDPSSQPAHSSDFFDGPATVQEALEWREEAFQNQHALGFGALEFEIDADEFLDRLENSFFEPNSMGYAIALLQDGNLLGTRIGGYARAEQDGAVRWTETTKLHIASTTKPITAMAILDALRERGLGVDETIGAYLPDYWAFGPGINAITFEQLLRHRSGLIANDSGNGGISFELAKNVVASGVEDVASGRCDLEQQTDPVPTEFATDREGSSVPFCPGDPRYQNVNFVIARVVAVILDERVDQDVCRGILDLDQCWDSETKAAFDEMIRDRVFEKASLSQIALGPSGRFALAYASKNDAQPGSSGASAARGVGAVGLFLSLLEMCDLVGQFTTEGVISAGDRLILLQGSYGYTRGFLALDGTDTLFETILLNGTRYPIHTWEGSWSRDVQAERNSIFFYPGNIVFIAMYNSDFEPVPTLDGTRPWPLSRWVRCAYVNAIAEGDDPIENRC